MPQVIKYECVMCGAVKESDRPTRTCSPRCRKAYQRYRERGGDELDFRPLSQVSRHNVTPPEAHEQAYKPPEGHKLITDEMHDLFMQLLREKKSGNQTTIFMPLSETTAYTETPPTEKPVVREVSDEERIKRTAANTAAALEDF